MLKTLTKITLSFTLDWAVGELFYSHSWSEIRTPTSTIGYSNSDSVGRYLLKVSSFPMLAGDIVLDNYYKGVGKSVINLLLAFNTCTDFIRKTPQIYNGEDFLTFEKGEIVQVSDRMKIATAGYNIVKILLFNTIDQIWEDEASPEVLCNVCEADPDFLIYS